MPDAMLRPELRISSPRVSSVARMQIEVAFEAQSSSYASPLIRAPLSRLLNPRRDEDNQLQTLAVLSYKISFAGRAVPLRDRA